MTTTFCPKPKQSRLTGRRARSATMDRPIITEFVELGTHLPARLTPAEHAAVVEADRAPSTQLRPVPLRPEWSVLDGASPDRVRVPQRPLWGSETDPDLQVADVEFDEPLRPLTPFVASEELQRQLANNERLGLADRNPRRIAAARLAHAESLGFVAFTERQAVAFLSGASEVRQMGWLDGRHVLFADSPRVYESAFPVPVYEGTNGRVRAPFLVGGLPHFTREIPAPVIDRMAAIQRAGVFDAFRIAAPAPFFSEPILDPASLRAMWDRLMQAKAFPYDPVVLGYVGWSDTPYFVAAF